MLIFIVTCYSLSAQTTSIENGIKYLEETQDSSGLWDTEGRTPFRNSCVAVRTLQAIDPYNQKLQTAIDTIKAYQDSLIIDYIARRTEVLAHEGLEDSSDISLLVSCQNADGGWGLDGELSSNFLHTILCINALSEAGFNDLNVIGKALGYLIYNNNEDGGWGFEIGDSSGVYYTALSILTLSKYTSIYDLSEQINNGAAWLVDQQNTNGSFGTDTTSIYETALSFIALQQGNSLEGIGYNQGNSLEGIGNNQGNSYEGIGYSENISKARNFLLSTQDTSGSWNDNAYETALAILALSTMSPNLFISSASTSPAAPVEGEEFTLSAVIKNIGTEKAGLFDTKFMLDTLVLWEGVVDSLLPGDSLIVDFSYNLPSGRYEIKGIVDFNDESPNSSVIIVSKMVDLSLTWIKHLLPLFDSFEEVVV